MFWNKFYDLCISIGSKPNPVGKKVGISSATITQWKQGAIPAGDNLVKIADFFDCSVDYLLGRTDDSQAHKKSSTLGITNHSGASGNISVGGSMSVGDSISAGNKISNTVPALKNSEVPFLDEHQKLLLDLYNKLSPMEQAKLLVYADELKGG